MFNWKESYNTGIAEIDSQHKELFRIGEKIYFLLKDEMRVDKYNEIVEIIENLKDYALFHFKTEEELLLKMKYKKFLSHKIEHNIYIERFNNIDYSKIDAGQDEYIVELLNILSDWISNHILSNDMDYVAVFKGK